MKKIMGANIFAAKADMTQEDWLESRRQGIGGSDAAAIVGLHPYKSALGVYLDKVGLAAEQTDNERMRQGRDLEEYVAQRFRENMKEQGTLKRTKNCNYILQHPKYPWMLANVDRLIVGENAGLECKTTSVLNLRRFRGGEYPVEYYVQCVHYLAVTGADRWYLGVLILNQGYNTYVIERKEAQPDIDDLIAAEQAFWERNVLQHIEPDPDGSDNAGELLREMYPLAREDEIDLSIYDADIERYMTLDAEIKEREREQETIKQRVQAFMRDVAYGHTDAYRIKWANVESKRMDTKALKADHPDVYEQYAKPSICRRFTVNEI